MRWLLFLVAFSLLAQDEELVAHHAVAAAADMQAGNYASAEQHNRAIVRLRPKLAEAEANLGLSCFLQKEYERAVQAFSTGLKLNPELDNARLFLGISQFKLGNATAALAILQRYASQHAGDFQGQYYLGLSYLELDRFTDAERPLITARDIDKRNVDVLYHLAQSYLGQARNDPSKRGVLAQSYRAAVEQIAAIDPTSFRLGQLRAGFYEADNKNTQAIQELESLLQHDPKAPGLHYTLGCLYTEQREYEKALDQFKAEMQIPDAQRRTYLQLAHVYVELRKPAEAMPLLDRAIQIDPSSKGIAWTEMGRAYRIMNKPDKSAAAFERAIAYGQSGSSIYYQLAVAEKNAGNLDRYREALNMSQRLRDAESIKKAPGTR
jgi:tetratricopeptide (TPR) repeat protein